MNKSCIFCNIPNERIVSENKLALVIRDAFPVTKLHTLIIPKRHIDTYKGLTEDEVMCCDDLVYTQMREIEKIDKEVKGFNIGINVGEVSGQTIFHCHIHLIPRRIGDVENPHGGVRNIIPNKGKYYA